MRWIALGIASLQLVSAGCSSRSEAEAPQSPPGEAWLTQKQMTDSQIAVAPVGVELVHSTIAAGGKITFDDLRVAHVFSPVTGRVTRVLAEPGQKVKKGTPLVAIASPDVSTASSDLAKANADLQAAEHEYNRQKELYEAHAGSRKDLETAEDNFRKGKAEYDRAKQKTQLLRSGSIDNVTQEYTLRAPIDGEIIARNVNPGIEVQGQYAGGNPAVELYTIGELATVWVIADVFEVDLPRIQKDADVSLKVVAYPGKTFKGKVDWVSGALDPTSRTAKVRCTLPNPDRELKPEMYATVSIGVAGERSLAVPRPAILRLGEQTVVFVQSGAAPDGRVRFERRPVKVDEEDTGDFVPIAAGLKAGEKVATSGAILLAGLI
jgi:cobalt-zinc-cadmium efflux system membrane fusion protein